MSQAFIISHNNANYHHMIFSITLNINSEEQCHKKLLHKYFSDAKYSASLSSLRKKLCRLGNVFMEEKNTKSKLYKKQQ